MWKRHKLFAILTFLTTFGFMISTFPTIIYKNGEKKDLISSSPFSTDTHPSIIVDGNEALNDFCSGNGTIGNFSNPYVISGYYIDANNSGSGIEIRNTDKYVVLNDFFVINSDSGGYSAGIKLFNCSNIKIENSTGKNNLNGIFIEDSENITILRNDFSNNKYGIYLWDSENNTLSNNNISSNENSGIKLNDSNNNTISFNSATHNFYGLNIEGFNNTIIGNSLLNNSYGVTIRDSFNVLRGNMVKFSSESGVSIHDFFTFLYNNTISDNGYTGIDLKNDANYNVLSHNVLVNNGIIIQDSFNNSIDESNIINGKPVMYFENQNGLIIDGISNIGQLILVNCNNSIISNSNISQTAGGILLSNSYNNFIFNNTMSFNSEYGIHLRHSNHNVLSDNRATYNLKGFFIRYSNNITLYNNLALFSIESGFELTGSYNCTISNNTALLNLNSGYLLSNSFNISLSSNKALENEYGIRLSSSSNNQLFSNNVSFNNDNGIQLEGSNNNRIFKNNIIENGMYGIRLEDIPDMMCICDSNDNKIYQNFINNNLKGCISDLGVDSQINDNECYNVSANEDFVILVASLSLLIGIISVISILLRKKFRRI